MKTLALGLLFLLACNPDPPANSVRTDHGKFTVNGKDCEVVLVDRPDNGNLWFIDCGPGSSAVNFRSGKMGVDVGIYNPPPPVAPPTPTIQLQATAPVGSVNPTFECKIKEGK